MKALMQVTKLTAILALMSFGCAGGDGVGGQGGQGGSEEEGGAGAGGSGGKQDAAPKDTAKLDMGGGGSGGGGMGGTTVKEDAGVVDMGGSAGTGGRDGSVADARTPDTSAPMGSYLPVKLGNTWTYKVTDPVDGISMKTVTIDLFEKTGGTGPNKDMMSYRHTTMKGAGDKTIGWWGLITPSTGPIVANWREQGFRANTTTVNIETWWDKYRTKFDEGAMRVRLNDTWMETFKEFKVQAGVTSSTTQSVTWKVLAVDEMVTVPAGTFRCIKVTHSLSGGVASGKFFWYARGVGKVKEEGAQKEELTAYTIK